ncbi:hypothetical protein EVAR_8275_1 [Eumeta japonica]|uniref:Uncharacterized protein n=1 Tax=Eumeta variegata TaxID=151549 RepID=A0A4C1TGV6_EUMVA|nr:hypothetical protein EVAR_8275_1 [Eumeta japonica]
MSAHTLCYLLAMLLAITVGQRRRHVARPESSRLQLKGDSFNFLHNRRPPRLIYDPNLLLVNQNAPASVPRLPELRCEALKNKIPRPA